MNRGFIHSERPHPVSLLVAALLFSVAGCDTLQLPNEEDDCVLEVPSGHAAFLSIDPDQQWRYTLLDRQRDIYGDWYEEVIHGEVLWEVTSVGCDAEGMSIGIRETVRGEKTVTRIRGWCCVSDPDTVVTKSEVLDIRHIDAGVRDEYLVIPGYTEYPGSASGTNRRPVARWLRASDSPSPVEDHETLFAGFGAHGTSRVVMEKDVGITEWEYDSYGSRPTTWLVYRMLTLIGPDN
jgi:hypothetical protein